MEQLFETFRNQVRPEADLVCYWFHKARKQIASLETQQSGLVATNSIRGGANRSVLDAILENGTIFDAWDDEPWVVEGAAVRVSLVCFGLSTWDGPAALDGKPVRRIHADLTAGSVDLTQAAVLRQNRNVAFMGDTKGGAFDIPGELAQEWLRLPRNPNGRPNSDVLKPWVNGMDVTRRPADKWIIDFGWEMTEAEAAQFEHPFEHILELVKPKRELNNRETYRVNWWRHVEPRQGMHEALNDLPRFIVTPTVAKHRLFAFLAAPTLADH